MDAVESGTCSAESCTHSVESGTCSAESCNLSVASGTHSVASGTHSVASGICSVCKYTTKVCICNKMWREFSSLLSLKIDNENEPSLLTISTITLNFNLSNCVLDIAKITEAFQETSVFKHILFTPNAKKSKNKDINNVMFNQCELKGELREFPKKCNIVGCSKKGCCQKSKLSLKVFKNGSFTLTGLRSIDGIPTIIRTVDYTIKNYNDVIVLNDNSKNCIMENVRISMLNTNFRINKQIRQNTLNSILNKPEYNISNGGNIKMSSFDRDKYIAINVKYIYREKMEKELEIANKKKKLKELNNQKPKNKDLFLTRKGREKLPGEVTLLIFGSGAIILTGGKDPIELMKAYTFINDILIKHKQEIQII